MKPVPIGQTTLSGYEPFDAFPLRNYSTIELLTTTYVHVALLPPHVSTTIRYHSLRYMVFQFINGDQCTIVLSPEGWHCQIAQVLTTAVALGPPQSASATRLQVQTSLPHLMGL